MNEWLLFETVQTNFRDESLMKTDQKIPETVAGLTSEFGLVFGIVADSVSDFCSASELGIFFLNDIFIIFDNSSGSLARFSA